MDHNNDHESIMENIIAGTNNIRTYTDEERSQADGFLNITDTHTEDDDAHA